MRLHFGVDPAKRYDVEIRFTDATVVSRVNLGAGIYVVDARPGR
jgi:hypothetical protein